MVSTPPARRHADRQLSEVRKGNDRHCLPTECCFGKIPLRCPALNELPAPPSGKTGWPWTEETPPPPEAKPDGLCWPRIGIVTPSYNQRPFIEETIRSVLLQGYPNLEYMIIDGGSTDGSLEIIRQYAPWLAYWVSEPDRGQSDAINKGWQHATGELLAWLNSDDVYEPQALLRVATARAAHPKAGLIHGLCLEFDETGVRRLIGGPYNMLTAITVSYDQGGRVAQPAAFVTRQAVSRVGMLDCRLKQSMDKDLWQRTAALYEVAFLPQTLARFRVHRQQLSQQHARDKNFLISRERHIAIENLFALKSLPPHVLRARRRALAKTHLQLALELRFAGTASLAFRHLLLGLASHVIGVRDRSDWRALGLALVGPRVASLLSTVKRRCIAAREGVK
jgi:glycosyltransferase involved in cell wall biosynthesis